MATAKLYNLARVTTTTVGTGPINLGSAVPGALTFADAGVQDGDVVSYSIKDGTASEVGRGTYSSTGPTLARTTVLKSTSGGSAISLTGNNAEVFITALAEDFDVTGNLAGGFWLSTDVGSAATCDIGATTAPYVRVTGTTTITSLGTGASKFRFVEFTGSLTLTYNGTSLILPGTANIVTNAGDKGIFVSDASGNWKCVAWTPIGFILREKLTADRSYYVRTDGSDSNNGLANTSSGAFATLQKAINVVAALDISIFNVTINVGAGTFTAGVNANGSFVGSGTVTISGAGSTSTTVNVTNGNCVASSNGAVVAITAMKLQTTTGGHCLLAALGGRINIGSDINFGSCAGFHMFAQGGVIDIFATAYAISGGAQVHYYADFGGLIFDDTTCAVTVTGTPNFSARFANSQAVSALRLISMTYTGSATGTRYYADGNGIINTGGGGSSYFPGSSAGSSATGGQYF